MTQERRTCGANETAVGRWVWAAVSLALLVCGAISGCSGRGGDSVVVYCAQDQVVAEPVFAEFTRLTGIQIKPVFDSEAVKTVGLANRLLAEKAYPVCEVWWGNEEFRTRYLATRGVFASTNRIWTFGRRFRSLVVAEGAVAVPASVLELTNSRWQGRVSVAFPMFGTTATHLLALRQRLGSEGWTAWCRALAANRPFIEEGNSMVVKRVARGEAVVGLTDTDDIAAGRREGLAIRGMMPDEWMLAIPNTVALVKPAAEGSPAMRLVEYLRSPEVIAKLVQEGALDALEHNSGVPGLKPDWDAMIRDLDPATAELEAIFRR